MDLFHLLNSRKTNLHMQPLRNNLGDIATTSNFFSFYFLLACSKKVINFKEFSGH